jgi:hypothetical protein
VRTLLHLSLYLTLQFQLLLPVHATVFVCACLALAWCSTWQENEQLASSNAFKLSTLLSPSPR